MLSRKPAISRPDALGDSLLGDLEHVLLAGQGVGLTVDGDVDVGESGDLGAVNLVL